MAYDERDQRQMLAIPREQAERQIVESLNKSAALSAMLTPKFNNWKDMERMFRAWVEYNLEMLRQMFTSPAISKEYVNLYSSVSREPFPKRIEEHRFKLEQIIERLPLIPEAEGIAPVRPKMPGPDAMPLNNRVFVVHGHDEGARETVARFLHQMELEPIILHEQASGGRSIFEKLEHHGDVGFAVILLTPDDIGAPIGKADALQPRARQNVVLELGYFVGRLGRARVCAIHKTSLELPSDILGVVYVQLDDGGGWKLSLARELKNAGFAIDMNQVI